VRGKDYKNDVIANFFRFTNDCILVVARSSCRGNWGRPVAIYHLSNEAPG
jgi:hypothetical protein